MIAFVPRRAAGAPDGSLPLARYRSELVWTPVQQAYSRRMGIEVLPATGAMEQVFLSDLFPGIIGFGRVHCVRYFLAVTGWHGFP